MKFRRETFKKIALFSPLALVAAGIFWFSPSGTAETPSQPLTTAFAKPAVLSDLADTLTYPARVVSKTNTAILAEADGVVGRIPASLGQKVGRRFQLMALSHT